MKKIIIISILISCAHLVFSQFPTESIFKLESQLYLTDAIANAGALQLDMSLSHSETIHRRVDFFLKFNQVDPIALTCPDTEILIEFDDGIGVRTFLGTQILQNGFLNYIIIYPTYGEKTIRVTINQCPSDISHSKTWEGEFTLNVVENIVDGTTYLYRAPDEIIELSVAPFSPPCSDAYPSNHPDGQPSEGFANAYIKYNNPNDKVLRKPILFIEGIDGKADENGGTFVDPSTGADKIVRYGSFGWDVFFPGWARNNGWEQLRSMPLQIESFLSDGYDIILLDFKDGADYIQKNAMLLEELLDYISLNKEGCEENVIIGASMGGQVARYALTSMEKRDKSHGCQLYISFDSPHQGANIPLSLQSAIYFFHSLFPNDKAIKEGWDFINRPASRQLLVENLFGAYQKGIINFSVFELSNSVIPDDDFNCLRNQYIADLNSKGYPLKTINLAIANGSKTMLGQPSLDDENNGSVLSSGDCFVSASESKVNINVFKLYMWLINGTGGGNRIFDGKIPNDVGNFTEILAYLFGLGDNPISFDRLIVDVSQNLPLYDNAPGGYFKSIESIIENIPEDYITCQETRHCFVPTVSALGINTTNLFLDINNLSTSNPTAIPFDGFFATDGLNQEHVEINDADLRDWLNVELNSYSLNLGSSLSNQTYNYGKGVNKISNIMVSENGFLRINDNGPTAFLNGPNADKIKFNVSTLACGGDITIQNKGYLILGNDDVVSGEPENRGNLYVTSGNKLHVENGGTLRLVRGSQLIIESGATLEIDAGANIDLWWGEYYPLGVHVDGSTIHIKEGGELVINGEFDFDGQGFFQFDQGNILTLNAPFVLEGAGKGKRFVRLNEGTNLKVNEGTIDWSSGKVEYLPNSKISLTEDGQAILEHMVFEGFDAEDGSIALEAEFADRIQLLSVRFNNFETGINAFGLDKDTDVFKIIATEFNQCETGIYGEYCKYINIVGCQFTPHDYNSQAIALVNVEKVGYTGSIADYNNEFGAVYISNDLSANNHSLSEITEFRAGGDILNSYIGIFVWDKSRANIIVTNNALIDNNTYGIHATGFSQEKTVFANVTVTRGATISNNQTGILIGKGMTYVNPAQNSTEFGMVEMTCAKMLDNMRGVEGEDLFLNIDACINSGQTVADCDFAQTNPSHFRNPYGGNLFRICYVHRNDENIDATGNYWEEVNANGNITVQPPSANNNIYDVLIGDTFTGNYCFGSTFNDSNPATNPAENCEEIIIVQIPPDITIDKGDCFTGGSPNTCLYSDGNNSDLVMNNQYRAAYTDYVNEDYEQAATKFEQLANITDNTNDGYCEPCQHYRNVARSRTFYNSSGAEKLLAQNNSNSLKSTAYKEKVKTSNPEFNVEIFPNPTNGILNIKTGSVMTNIRILDIRGRVLFSEQQSGDFQVNTKEWNPGVYVVEIFESSSGEMIRKKVVVQP